MTVCHTRGGVQVQPNADGSQAIVWLHPEWFYRRDEFNPAMIEGC